jgi:replicative superfamily II helicase
MSYFSSCHVLDIRLIALSATVPNISDVAEWLGDGGVADQNERALTGQAPAKTFMFVQQFDSMFDSSG